MHEENTVNKVCVIMSTFNGEKYICEQIDSILGQIDVDVTLLVRDDGSVDGTNSILEKYATSDKIDIADNYYGKHWQYGVGGSFFLLLREAFDRYPDIKYFAFADQDDVWLSNKLSRAVETIERCGDKRALYFSKKTIVDNNLQKIGEDNISFENSLCDFLIPNEASGCTMVINRDYAAYLLQGKVETYPYIHDVVLLKLAVCSNVEIIYDPYESILYRQHVNNTVGYKKNVVVSTQNIKKLFEKRKHYLSKLANDILSEYEPTKEATELLKRIVSCRHMKNKVYLLKYFIKNSNRKLKYLCRFCMTIMLNGL